MPCPIVPSYLTYILGTWPLEHKGKRCLILVGPSDQNSASTRPKTDLFLLGSIPIRQAEFLKQGHGFTW